MTPGVSTPGFLILICPLSVLLLYLLAGQTAIAFRRQTFYPRDKNKKVVFILIITFKNYSKTIFYLS